MVNGIILIAAHAEREYIVNYVITMIHFSTGCIVFLYDPFTALTLVKLLLDVCQLNYILFLEKNIFSLLIKIY